MNRSRRFVISSFVVLASSAFVGCGGSETLDPTPTSPLVTVTMANDTSYVISYPPDQWILIVNFTIANTSTEPIYFNLNCLIVLQRATGSRWEDVLNNGCLPGLSTRIEPGQLPLGITWSPVGSRNGDVPKEGTYRVRISLFSDEERKVPLPADAGYSKPFNVKIDFSRSFP